MPVSDFAEVFAMKSDKGISSSMQKSALPTATFCLRFKFFQNVGVNLKASCVKLQSGAGVYHLKPQRPVKISAGIGSLYGDYEVVYIFEHGYFLQNM